MKTRTEQAEAEADAPRCPQCGKPMRQRIARKGAQAGKGFWGCTAYPDCKGTREISGEV